MGLQETPDRDIFLQARGASAVIVTKDEDFANLVSTLGPPPQIIWVRVGNTRTLALLDRIGRQFEALIDRLRHDEPVIVIE